MKTPQPRSQKYGATLVALSALLLSACGGAPYYESAQDPASVPGSSTSGTGSGTGTGTGTGSGTGTGTGTTTTDPNLPPPIAFNFSNQGVAGSMTTPGVSTDNKLVVTVTLGQPTTIPGTGYMAAYTCARLTISAAGLSRTVFLTNGNTTFRLPGALDPCIGAVTSADVDFSGQLTTGHGPVPITVKNDSYDNCSRLGYPSSSGCGPFTVYTTHIVQGLIEVHVNGTR